MLERVGAVCELSSHAAPRVVRYVNTRDFCSDPESGLARDCSDLGVLAVTRDVRPLT